MKPQWSLDLTVIDRDDGMPSNFNEEDKRRKAVELLNRDVPDLLMLGPTCAPFSSLNIGWQYNRMMIDNAQNMIEDGMRHLAFATELSVHQSKRGKYFVIEHPASAASWQTETIDTLRSLPGVREVEFDFCSLGMTSKDEMGQAPVKKRTRIITNCPALIDELRKHQCTRGS